MSISQIPEAARLRAFRLAGAFSGASLMWFGAGQLSFMGLALMLLGLVAMVLAAIQPVPLRS